MRVRVRVRFRVDSRVNMYGPVGEGKEGFRFGFTEGREGKAERPKGALNGRRAAGRD